MAIETTNGGGAQDLRGAIVRSVHRKGKTLFLELRRDRTGQESEFLLWNLGMTGQLVLTASDEPVAAHTHVRLRLDDGREELRYRDVRRFGRIRWCGSQESKRVLSRLGPDAARVKSKTFVKLLEGRRGAVKSLLLNQQILAGLGNIYADESLFDAGIHPLTPAGRIPPSKALALHRGVHLVLRRAIRSGGTSFRDFVDAEGNPGWFQVRLRVYGRAGQDCRRCGTLIEKIIVGGRGSHFCARCQPSPLNLDSRRTVGRTHE
jgi:formamidopyrimidine-DNA glycosylase